MHGVRDAGWGSIALGGSRYVVWCISTGQLAVRGAGPDPIRVRPIGGPRFVVSLVSFLYLQ